MSKMVYQGRLHLPQGYYFIREVFQPQIELLIPTPGRPHAAEELTYIAMRRTHYEAQLAYAATRWRVRVHAYCWLSDCALLLVQNGYAPLAWFMHSLRSPFSRHVLKVMGIKKPYLGRYHALLTDEREFFFDVVRYILSRPREIGLCDEPLDYDYSSARTCLGGSAPPFLTQSFLPLAASLGFNTRQGLAAFLNRKPQPGFTVLIERGSLLDSRVLGRADFAYRVQRESRRPCAEARPQPCIEWVARYLGIEKVNTLSKPRCANAVQARALAGWLVTCAGVAHVSTVAQWFNTDRSSLERAIDWHARNTPNLFNDRILEDFHSFLMTATDGSSMVKAVAPAKCSVTST